MQFKFDSAKKTYYVDGHEHAAQKLHRFIFAKEYLLELETRMHRWIQIEKEEVITLCQSGKLHQGCRDRYRHD